MEMKQWEHIARERPILRKIEDIAGRAMYTEQRLFSYLQQFERDFAMSRSRIIDATEGGAKKRGAEVMNLVDMLASLRPHRFDFSTVGPAMPDKQCALPALERRLGESREIAEIARQTLSLLQEVAICLDDQPRVNRLIAKIDTLRARMLQLNDCYELITALSQQSELDRFRTDRQLAAAALEGIDRQKAQLKRDIANVQSLLAGCQAFSAMVKATIKTLGAR
jgi:hypothetical protein